LSDLATICPADPSPAFTTGHQACGEPAMKDAAR